MLSLSFRTTSYSTALSEPCHIDAPRREDILRLVYAFAVSKQWDAFVNEAGDGGRTCSSLLPRHQHNCNWHCRACRRAEERSPTAFGSLDNLITAEGRKLDALRQHKQGLMQRLFPRPGETKPIASDSLSFRNHRSGVSSHLENCSRRQRAAHPTVPDLNTGMVKIPWVTTSIIDFNIIKSTREFISTAGAVQLVCKSVP